jgi:hypothetical protein
LIQLSSSTTQSTKIVATGERHYKIHQNQKRHIVYFDVDGKEYDTEAYSDSIPAQILVHYFAFFPFVFPTANINDEQGKIAGFVLFDALIDKWTWLLVTPVWIGFLPFLFLLVWFFWALNREVWYIKIARNGELALGTYEYKPFSETEINKEVNMLKISEAEKAIKKKEALAMPARKMENLVFVDKKEEEHCVNIQRLDISEKERISLLILYLPKKPNNFLFIGNLPQFIQDKLAPEIQRLKN